MPFLTPAEPSAWACIEVQIPNTLLPAFIGALVEMCGVDAWELYQGLSCDLASNYSYDILDSFIYSPIVPPWLYPLTGDGIDPLGDSNGGYLTEG